MDWTDALLTERGIDQARIAHSFWEEALSDGMPAPETFYTSPLRRCLQTSCLSFDGISLPKRQQLSIVVKESLRETVGRHSCDQRSNLSIIRRFASELAPGVFSFESSFEEQDELWDTELREQDDQTQARLRSFLDDIFERDPATWISLTIHSGTCRAILAVVGHRLFRLQQGSAMAVLVKATRVG